ncbi:hypothetical protein ACWD4O_35310 [Streptomyces sp. NPDC002623]
MLQAAGRRRRPATGDRRLPAVLGTTCFPAVFGAGARLPDQRGTDAARAGVQQIRGDNAEPTVQIGFGAA